MEKTLKINFRRLSSGNYAPEQEARTFDEFLWSDVYELKVFNDDGSHGMPFCFADDETLTLVVKDHPEDAEAKLQKERRIVQTLTYVQRSTGNVFTCTRTRSHNGSDYVWSEWSVTKATEGINIEWNNASHINNYTEQGTYNITGERTNGNDGLPIANAAPGHTIAGRLFVLDSTINENEVCVTQVLMLSNRLGGDGNTYIRTGKAAGKELLKSPGSTAWSKWGKLQQNVETGQVASLDPFIDNGIYSGVYAAGGAFETFVMVVINNYDVAGALGQTRSISQFKYALNVDGTFSYKTRKGSGNGNIVWGEWGDLGAAATNDIQDGAVTAQKLCADVREKIDNPLRPLFIAAGALYNDTASDISRTAPWGETVTHKPGHYYLNGLGDITEDQMLDIYREKELVYRLGFDRIMQNPTYLNSIRTIIPISNSRFVGHILKNNPLGCMYSFFGCKNLEVLMWSRLATMDETRSDYLVPISKDSYSNFASCSKLRIIYPMDCSVCTRFVNTFADCYDLVQVRLYGIVASVSLSCSPLVNIESILYMIQNAAPLTAITITLHPDAYARLVDDADIVAALEAQPLISLVSA